MNHLMLNDSLRRKKAVILLGLTKNNLNLIRVFKQNTLSLKMAKHFKRKQ